MSQPAAAVGTLRRSVKAPATARQTGVAPEAREAIAASETPIHQALVRPLLYLGVERHVIALESTLCAAVLFAARPSVLSATVVVLVLAVIHPTLAWLTTKDPMITELYLRHASYAGFYAPNGKPSRRSRRQHTSVPR